METIISRDILQAKKLLDQGELVAIPTETVYGLAGNALDENAVIKIFSTKKRPSFDPLIVHISSFDDVTKWVKEVPDIYRELSGQFCPGPLTFIFNKKDIIPDLVTSGLQTIAIRIPNHPLTLELLDSLEYPLAAPSANLFGRTSPTSPSHVYSQLSGMIPMILDGGSCQWGIESTIVSFENNTLNILRQGSTTMEELSHFLSGKVPVKIQPSSGVPGQMKMHYAPSIPLYFGDVETYLNRFKSQRIGLITFTRTFSLPGVTNYVLSPGGNLTEAARNLFKAIHELEKAPVELIIAEEFPDEFLGKAINDRLKRASVNY